MFVPMIKKLEGNEHKGIVDLVMFGGASKVQKAGQILSKRFPRISAFHGAENVVSLFFSDCYTKIKEFQDLRCFTRLVRNVFGSTRHAPTAIFDKQSKMHNNGRGLVKPCEVRMGGKIIFCMLSIVSFTVT